MSDDFHDDFAVGPVLVHHGVRPPFFLGIFSAVLLIPSFFVSAYLSSFLLVLLFIATIWNTGAARRLSQA